MNTQVNKGNRYLSKLKTGVIILSSVMAMASFDAFVTHHTVAASETKIAFAATQNDFLNKVIPHAYELAHENDLYASVMIAQAILESGWGNSTLASEPNNNLFGIKGNYNGETVVMDTLEDAGGQNYYQIKDGFRKYPSYRESLTDYVGVLKNGPSFDPNYYSGAWKSNTTSYTDATAWLTGRYATDTAYSAKLNNLITSNGLYQYDTPIGAAADAGNISGVLVPASQVDAYNAGNQALLQKWEEQQAEMAQQNAARTITGSYSVKPGDGLYGDCADPGDNGCGIEGHQWVDL